jgi:hypothetical protein
MITIATITLASAGVAALTARYGADSRRSDLSRDSWPAEG